MKIAYENEPLDVCAKCSKVQEYGTMTDVYHDTFDIFCNKCLQKKVTEKEVQNYFANKANLVYVLTQILNKEVDIKKLFAEIKHMKSF